MILRDDSPRQMIVFRSFYYTRIFFFLSSTKREKMRKKDLQTVFRSHLFVRFDT